MVINAVVDPGPDDSAVTARLLQNPKDVAEIYREFYGDAAAREIDRIITEHLTVAKQLVVATVQGNTSRAGALKTAWYANADEWAAYLGKLSPNMNEADMRNMLYTHLDLVIEQVTARIAKNYTANVISYDEGEDMALEMADTMSDAIIKQFPERFN